MKWKEAKMWGSLFSLIFSETGTKLEFLSVAAILLFVSWRIVGIQSRWLEGLQPGFFDLPKAGRPAVRRSTLERQYEKVKNFRKGRAVQLVLRGMLLFLAGVLIPTLLAAIAWFEYTWFFPNARAFVVLHSTGLPVSVRSAEPAALVRFFVSQFVPLMTSDLDYDHSSIPLSLMFGLYKAWVSGYVIFVLGNFAAKGSKGFFYATEKEKELSDALNTFPGHG